MAEIDKTQVASSIREAINDSPKKSKRVLLKTLLKMFGHKTRQRHWIEAMGKRGQKTGSGFQDNKLTYPNSKPSKRGHIYFDLYKAIIF